MSVAECSHCGLPVDGGEQTGDEPVFCCAGCEAVWRTLHDAGLEQFYNHRDSWSVDDPRPVDEEVVGSEESSVFDNPAFLDEHAQQLDDGTMRIELHLQGVHCAGCVWLVERMPGLVDGVVEARLELTRGRMTLRWNPERVELSKVAEWLSRFGFRAHPLRSDSVQQRGSAGRRMLTRVGICWAVAANVMLLTIAVYAGLDAQADPGLYATVLWTTFGLSVVSLLVGATVFFRRAFANLKTGRLSMDVPISLGIAVGWGHSAWATITGSGEVWFDSIVVLTAALLTARYLQIRGNAVAADAADRLLSLLPNTARRIVEDSPGGSQTETVPADALRVGDRIRVLSGDVVPADGRVVEGQGEVSRAVLTGESRPESVTPGQSVEAGSKNLANPLVVQITATGEATRVGRLMEWVQSRGGRRAPVVQLADRLSAWFVGFVLVAAAATAVTWGFIEPSRAVANTVALLVIACPCALGMATPLALTVGAGRAARRGIHIKRDDALEVLDGVTDVVFDKTGTLTFGRPAVVEVYGDEQLAAAACALETRSSHPLADALLRWAQRREDTHTTRPGDRRLEDVEEKPGAGIRGIVDGQRLTVGRLSWFQQLPPAPRRWAKQCIADNLTPVAVGLDGRVEAVIAVGDQVRPKARQMLEEMRRRGIRTHLLSGDHPEIVASLGERLGFVPRRVVGGADPEQKLEYIRSVSGADASVAMVGDGVNDAAALEAAHVGVAVHGGAEASLATADVFMGKEGVQTVRELLDGAADTMKVVRRNLAAAGVYNLFGISLAAMGYITPLAAAVLMPISSLGVVTSSLIQSSFPRRSNSTDASREVTS